MSEEERIFGSLLDRARALDIRLGARAIEAGDEFALLPEEAPAFAKAAVKVRRQSGAARIVARTLLEELGLPVGPIVKGPAGAPIWPAGVVGSLAHESNIAVAAIATSRSGLSIGIDIEPDEALAEALVDLVATSAERNRYSADLLRRKTLFVAKEAVYKASFPLDAKFLDFQDVEVDLERGIARTVHGLEVDIAVSHTAHVAALAIARRAA